MTPEERSLIDDLFRRLRDAEVQPRDPEAERLIRDAVQHQPNAVYYMAQAVLFQQQALAAAQQKIDALESRIRTLETAAPATQPAGGGFLGGVRNLWGAPPPSPAAALPPQMPPPQAPAESAGPWGRRLSYPAAPTAPMGYGQGYGQPGFPAAGYAPQGGGFLSGAAQTAVGVAGGMLAASAIQSLFSSGTAHAAQALDAAQPMMSETVVNNYFGNPPPDTAQDDAGLDDAGFDNGNGDSGDDWI